MLSFHIEPALTGTQTTNIFYPLLLKITSLSGTRSAFQEATGDSLSNVPSLRYPGQSSSQPPVFVSLLQIPEPQCSDPNVRAFG